MVDWIGWAKGKNISRGKGISKGCVKMEWMGEASLLNWVRRGKKCGEKWEGVKGGRYQSTLGPFLFFSLSLVDDEIGDIVVYFEFHKFC